MERLPNELWLEVCPYLPLDAVRSLSSTNRSLYAVARPLSFTEFKLYPYPYQYNPPQELLADALARLAFYSSENIAPLVRTCTARLNRDPRRWPPCDSPQGDHERDGHALMNAFFVRLPRFTGLQRLYADRIRLTKAGLEALSVLPPLQHAEFDVCTFTRTQGEQLTSSDAAKPTLRVANFGARYFTDTVWLTLLCRESLRVLNLSDFRPLAHPSVGLFPYVHTLTAIPCDLNALTIFAKFPALRVLITDYRGVLRDPTPAQEAAIFPLLEEYTGPPENLHIFAQLPTLSHITINTGIALTRLSAEFLGVALPLSNITSLTSKFFTASVGECIFGRAEMDTIFSWFPRLKKLELTFYPDVDYGGEFAPRPTSLIKTSLTANPLLPGTLESISLEWDFPVAPDADSDTDSATDRVPAPPTDEFPATAVRDALISRCPALGYIYLDGYHFAYVWWKTSWVWEAAAGSYADAEDLRARKDERMCGPPILLS